MNAPYRLLTSPERMRLSVENFELLNDNGAFSDYTKTELIDGDIYVMNAQWNRHARVKSRLYFALASRLAAIGSDLEAVVEVAVRVAADSMPEPDIVLTRWNGAGAVPGEAVALAIEIADTTLDTDLGRKSDLYAAAGIPEYWVVDLSENRVLVHEYPEPDGYRGQGDLLLGDVLHSATIEGLSVETANLVLSAS